MTCQQALNLLYDIIDKEAEHIDINKVQAHLANCHDCAGIFRVESAVNDLVRERLGNPEPTPRLEILKSKVLTQLDNIDRVMKGTDSQDTNSASDFGISGTKWGRLMAVAASVIVVFGAVYFGRAFFAHNDVYIPLEQSHWQVTEHMDDYRDPTNTLTARASVENEIGYEVQPRLYDLDLVGGRLTVIDGVEMAHFVYASGDLVASLFIVDPELFEIPDDLLHTAVAQGGITLYDHDCRGCRLVYYREGRALVIAASTQQQIDLLDIVPRQRAI